MHGRGSMDCCGPSELPFVYDVFNVIIALILIGILSFLFFNLCLCIYVHLYMSMYICVCKSNAWSVIFQVSFPIDVC